MINSFIITTAFHWVQIDGIPAKLRLQQIQINQPIRTVQSSSAQHSTDYFTIPGLYDGLACDIRNIITLLLDWQQSKKKYHEFLVALEYSH